MYLIIPATHMVLSQLSVDKESSFSVCQVCCRIIEVSLKWHDVYKQSSDMDSIMQLTEIFFVL